MIIGPEQSERLRCKADPMLEKALEEAEEDKVLRAVMVLGPEDDAEPETEDMKPAFSEFPSKRAYRQALIERQQDRLTRKLGPTMRQLEELSLRPRGLATSGAVVVQGPARQILHSLELPGVRHASLDRKLNLVRPDGAVGKSRSEPGDP